MKRIIYVIIFVLLSVFSSAEAIGEKYFSKKTDFYFLSNGADIFNINDENIKKYNSFILDYDYYKGIEISKYLKNREYAVSFIGKESKNNIFVVAIKMGLDEFLNGNFYKNKNFEEESMQGINTYYAYGQKEMVYSYRQGVLYISNNITYFLEVMNNISYSQNTLSDDFIFNKILNTFDNYSYYYFFRKEGVVKKHKYTAFSIKKNDETTEKMYYVPDLNYKDAEKIYNFSDFVPDKINGIQHGNTLNIIIENIKNKYEFITENKEMENKIEKVSFFRGIILAVTKDNNDEYYAVYIESDIETFVNEIKEAYENLLFYDKKLELNKEDGLYWFEIPVLGQKLYIGLVREKYVVITYKKEIYDDIKSGKYYNYNYLKLSNEKEYSENFVTESKKIIEIDVNLIKETEIN